MLAALILTTVSVGTVSAEQVEPLQVDGVNYFDIKSMAAKHEVSVQEIGTDLRLQRGDLEVIVASENSSSFYVGDETYLGVRPTFKKDGVSYMAARDWATIFNMSLTYVDGVTTLTKTELQPNLNDNSFDEGVYRIGKSWGNKQPMTMTRNTPPANVTTPIMDTKVYFKDRRNDIEGVAQESE